MLYGAGLRVSEALNLTLPDVDTSAGTLRIRDSKNGQGRTVPITGRLTATLDAYIAAAHPAPEHQRPRVLQHRCRQADQPGDRLHAVPRLPGRCRHPPLHRRSRTRTRCATASPSPTCDAGPQHGADLAVMLPYLACYMGHADLRGTQYYLRLTADAYPEVMAKAQIRFGYVIPAPPEDES